MKERIVIALGGNALGSTPDEQLRLVKKTAKTIVDLKGQGYDIIVGHGNGPQIGMINLGMDFSSKNGGNTPLIPIPECGAMSQGYIGYHLQQAIQNELKARNMHVECATIVTQIVVDENDPAFKNPTKPIGSYVSKEEADKYTKESGFTFMFDSLKGYRRVVPSPLPKRIVEIETIKLLAEQGTIVICVGGGGIPVIEKGDELVGIPAVIDKDRSSERLALDLNADKLIILTNVEKVSLNYRKPNQLELDEISIEECEKFIETKEFGVGSMLPKVEACMDFVKISHKEALITSLEKADLALKGNTGTRIR